MLISDIWCLWVPNYSNPPLMISAWASTKKTLINKLRTSLHGGSLDDDINLARLFSCISDQVEKLFLGWVGWDYQDWGGVELWWRSRADSKMQLHFSDIHRSDSSEAELDKSEQITLLKDNAGYNSISDWPINLQAEVQHQHTSPSLWVLNFLHPFIVGMIQDWIHLVPMFAYFGVFRPSAGHGQHFLNGCDVGSFNGNRSCPRKRWWKCRDIWWSPRDIDKRRFTFSLFAAFCI